MTDISAEEIEQASAHGLVRAREGDAFVCKGWTLADLDNRLDKWGPDATDRFLQAVLEQKVDELMRKAES